jgi:hypothetical protein
MLDITCETLLRALPSFKPGAINIAGRDIVFNNVEKAGDLAQTTFLRITSRVARLLSSGMPLSLPPSEVSFTLLRT